MTWADECCTDRGETTANPYRLGAEFTWAAPPLRTAGPVVSSERLRK